MSEGLQAEQRFFHQPTGLQPVGVQSVIAACLGLAIGCRAENPNNQTARAVEEEPAYTNLWSTIRSATIDEDPKHDEVERWAGLAARLQAQLRKAVDTNDLEGLFAFYVQQFGKFGPQDDVRWFLSANGISVFDRASGPIALGSAIPNAREAELALCETLVRRLVRDDKIRQRYWEVVLYSRGLFDEHSKQGSLFGIEMAKLDKGFSGENQGEYWFFARRFVILAHISGWENHIQDYDADKLVNAYHDWRAWFKENETYLIADQKHHTWHVDQHAKEQRKKSNEKGDLPELEYPSLPFADWKGPPPPTSVMRFESPRAKNETSGKPANR